MLFLKSWLQDYVNLNLTDEKLAQIITTKSSEVEEIRSIVDYFESLVVIGRIENVQKHPESSKLQIFEVNLGQNSQKLGGIKNENESKNEDKIGEKTEKKVKIKKAQIVSAATNVREGLLVPVALVGAKLPFFSVGAKKLAGIESQGICLGMSELALETNYSSGLWELNELLSQLLQNKTIENSKVEQKLNSENFKTTEVEKKVKSKISENQTISVISENLENNLLNKVNLGKSPENKTKNELNLEAENLEKSRNLEIENSLEIFLGKSICEVLPQFFPSQTVLDIKVLPDQISRIGHHLGMALEIATILENHDLLTELGQRALQFGNMLNENSENLADLETLENEIENGLKNVEIKGKNEDTDEDKKEQINFNSLDKNSEKNSEKNTEEIQKHEFQDNFGGTNSFYLYDLKLEKPFALPHFLQTRMFLSGRNLVGGVVDLSNYLLVDMGQPSHFFDAKKV